MSRLPRLLFPAVFAGAILYGSVARAGDAQGFLHQKHQSLETLLRQPSNAAREGQVSDLLASMVDYDELTRRSFGTPCPLGLTSCKDYWTGLTDDQHVQVRDLLRKLVEKNYKKNLAKTLDYEISYKGARDLGGDSKILTEAKSKLKTRDPAVRVDYVVRPKDGEFRVVDIVTEGSSLTKNYYDQFKKMLDTPEQGFSYIVTKLQNRINKAD